MPSGQGSAAQQTPQPLQGWPKAGLAGAWRWRWTVWYMAGGVGASGHSTVDRYAMAAPVAQPACATLTPP